MVFALAAVLLSIERIAYVWISNAPTSFVAWAGSTAGRAGSPVDAVRMLFLAFKGVQGVVFLAWILVHGGGHVFPPPGGWPACVAGGLAILVGQTFTLTAFRQLGKIGVFYGNQFGHPVARSRAFPYSLMAHPQYVGAVISIWGLFLMLRFPHPDWYLLPLLESVYYAVGSKLER